MQVYLQPEKRGVRIGKRGNPVDSKVSEDRGAESASCTRAQIILQPMVKIMESQAAHGGLQQSRDVPAAHAGPPTGADECLKEALPPWKTMLEQAC